MHNRIETTVAGEKLTLLSEKAILWSEKKILIISDLHLGKINHFRRKGIPIPTKANHKNIETLINLLQEFHPKEVIFLGDLFHSHYNQEWEVFGQMLSYFPNVSFRLVKGNHDIMSEHQYRKYNIQIHDPYFKLFPFIFAHDEIELPDDDCFLLTGHIHPGVMVRGKGRQRLKLPCFYFNSTRGLLPAFGQFTGTAPITVKEGDEVYVLVDNRIVKK